MRSQLALLVASFAVFGLFTQASAQQQPEEPIRAITNITGDLYRAQNNFHFTVFLLTPEGIILADPINEEFATWLKAELAERYDVPVRYVLYSHHHWDHAAGGDVFADTAEFVGHANMTKNLEAVAGDERYDAVRAPDTTYSDRTTISLGGKTVEMVHSRPSHSDDMSVILFPEERTAFAVDFVSAKQLPFRTMQGAPPSAWIAAVEQLEGLNYEILALAHGNNGTKADVTAYKGYIQELVAAVSAGIAEGKSVAELQQSIMLEDYKDWGQYEAWRAENIQGAYEHLTRNN